MAHLDWSEEASEPLRQMRIRQREAYPSEQEILDRRPTLGSDGMIALTAWEAASSCRSIGFSLGPIPQTAIDAWCDRRGLDLVESDYLTDVLRYVDGVVLEKHRPKRS